MSLLIPSGSTSPVHTVGGLPQARGASLERGPRARFVPWVACHRRAGLHSNGVREAGSSRRWPATGARGFIGTGSASPVRTVGGLPQARGASLERGPRARFVPWVACHRRAGLHSNGVREAGSSRRWPATGARGFIGTGSASPVRTVGGLPQARGASFERGPRGRFVPPVACHRRAGLHWNGVREPGSYRGWPATGARGFIGTGSASPVRTVGGLPQARGASLRRGRMPRHLPGRCSMVKEISIVHHADRRADVVMPYAPGIVVRRGSLVFLSGVTAAAVYHSHPHRDEEFDLPATMEAQAVRAMENLKKTLEAAGCTLDDLVAATRYLTDVSEQDDLNRVWARYLGGHLPATTTVEVSRLATHTRCKLEISAIAVADGA